MSCKRSRRLHILMLLHGHAKVPPDKLRVRFQGFGAYSLDLDYPPKGSPLSTLTDASACLTTPPFPFYRRVACGSIWAVRPIWNPRQPC